MEQQRACWAREQVEAKQHARDWSKLPSDFEACAVTVLYMSIKPFFSKHEIRARIAASKATTFQDLLECIENTD